MVERTRIQPPTTRVVVAMLLALITLLVLTPAPPAAAATSTEIVAGNASYQSRRTSGAAVYDSVSKNTYVAWSGEGMDVYIRSYSHVTSTWATIKKVAEWNDSSTYAYHDYTVLELLPNGKLAIFVADHTTSLVQYTSPTANSASGTWTKTTISTDKVTYPEPVVVGSNIHLFYSRNDDLTWPYRSYKAMTSTDSGQTWGASRTVIDTGRSADKFSEVYAFSGSPIGGKACVTWTLAGGTGHNAQAKNLYAACLDPSTNTMHGLGGQNLGTTIDLAEHETAKVLTAATSTAAARPIDLSSLTWDPNTNQYLLGVGYTLDGIKRVDVGRVGTTGVSWTRVVTGTTQLRDVVWNGQGAEVLVVSSDSTRIGTYQVAGTTVSALTDQAIPYGTSGANSVWTANFVENRQSVSFVGYTMESSTRTTNYTGAWPVFAGMR